MPLGKKARIVSPTFLGVSPSTKCDIRIFYHMYGKTIGAFNVYSRTTIGGGENILFKKTNEVGDFWNRIDIPIKESQPFQILIEGVVGSSFEGDIAVDDITFSLGCKVSNTTELPSIITSTQRTTLGPCGDQFQCRSGMCVPSNSVCNFKYECDDKSDEDNCGTCDFETSMCGWYDRSDDRLVWTRRKAPSQNPKGPQIDHTIGTQAGSFLITQIDENGGEYSYNSVLLGPRLEATSQTCKMSMYVHMNDPFTSDITFYFNNVSNYYDYEYLDSLDGPLGNDWQYVEVFIGAFPANYHVEVMTYPEYDDDDYYGDVAIDDVLFSNCSPEPLIDASLDCNFDQSFCNYFKDPTSDFDWTRSKGFPYLSTGPASDHTSGSGYYAAMEAYYPVEPNERARLVSTLQTFTNQEICFKFWYLMFGADVETLNVYLDQYQTSTSTTFNRTLIWKKTGSYGRKWYEATKTILSNVPWKITFEGVIGERTILSDIAIDDVSSISSTCPPAKYCDFEADFCNYANSNENTMNWIRGQPTLTSVDHTTGTYAGMFAYVDMKSGSQNSKARLVSNSYLTQGPECLKFWYLASGLNTGTLNIYEKLNDNYGESIWTKNSHVEDDWRFGQISIGAHSFPNYQLVFEGVKLTNSQLGILGIDDVDLQNGSCLIGSLYDWYLVKD